MPKNEVVKKKPCHKKKPQRLSKKALIRKRKKLKKIF